MIILSLIMAIGVMSNETINYQHCKQQGFSGGTYIKLVSRRVLPCSHYSPLAQFDKSLKDNRK